MAERNDIVIGMQVEDSGAKKALDDAQKKIQGLEKELHKTRKAADDLGDGADRVGGKFAGLEQVATRVGGAMLAAFSVQKLAEYLGKLIEIEQQLGKNAIKESRDVAGVIASTIGTADAGKAMALRGGIQGIAGQARNVDDIGAAQIFGRAYVSTGNNQESALNIARVVAIRGGNLALPQGVLEDLSDFTGARMQAGATGSAEEEFAKSLAVYQTVGPAGMQGLLGLTRQLGASFNLPQGDRARGVESITAMGTSAVRAGEDVRLVERVIQAAANRGAVPRLAAMSDVQALGEFGANRITDAEFATLGIDAGIAGRIRRGMRFYGEQMGTLRSVGPDYLRQAEAGAESVLGPAAIIEDEAKAIIRKAEDASEDATGVREARRSLAAANAYKIFSPQVASLLEMPIRGNVMGIQFMDALGTKIANQPVDTGGFYMTPEMAQKGAEFLGLGRSDAGTSPTLNVQVTVRTEDSRGARSQTDVQSEYQGVN
jgi:hypothetical protein